MNHWNPPARLFKILGHPARLAILAILREGEECVCHLEAVLGYRQAYISQHLMTLREAGLVRDRREGANVFYRVIDRGVFAAIDAGLTVAALAAPGVTAPQLDCLCPKCQPVVEPGLA